MSESYSVKAILSAQDKNFSSTFQNAQNILGNLSSTISGGLGFGALMSLGEKAVNVVTSGFSEMLGSLNDNSKAWQTFEGNMKAFGKSSKQIASVKSELQEFATQTIYSASDMASTYAQLEAVGVKNTAALVKGFGGLAAASENPAQAMKTLSQQATQAAAKPTLAWMDYKLMLEQTPAGMAAVAKEMGMSTSEMITAVQDGQVKTQDFFDAIAKVGGDVNSDFYKMATSYKTVDQAMDGLTETLTNKLQPAFDKVSEIGIAGVEKVTNLIDKFDFSALEAYLTVDNLKGVLASVGAVGAAAFAAPYVSDFTKLISFGMDKVGTGAKTAALAVKGIPGALQNMATKGYGHLIKLGSGLQRLFPADKVVAFRNSLKNVGASASKAFSPFVKIGKTVTGVFNKIAGVGVGTMGGMFKALGGIMKAGLAALGPAALVGAALAGLGLLYSQFGDQIDSLIDLGKTKGPEIIRNLTKGVVRQLPGFIDSGAKLVTGLLGMITANLPRLLSSGVRIVTVLVQGVMRNAPQLISSAASLIGTFASRLLMAVPQLLMLGVQLIQSLVSGLMSNIGEITQGASMILTQFVNSLVSMLPTLISTGLSIITMLAQGVVSALPQLIVAGIGAITSLITGISNMIPTVLSAGIQIIGMLINGIVQNLPTILQAGAGAIQALLQGIVQNLPSIIVAGFEIISMLIKSLIENGPQIVETGWELIKSLGQGIAEAVPEIITSAVEGIKGVFSDLKSFITGDTAAMNSTTVASTTAAASQVTSSWETTSASVKGSASTMSSGVTADTASMAASVTGNLATMQGTATTGFSTMAASLMSESSLMESSVAGSFTGLSNTASSSLSNLGSGSVSSIQNISSQTTASAAEMQSSMNSAMTGMQSAVTSGMNATKAAFTSSLKNMTSVLRSSSSAMRSTMQSAMSSITAAVSSGSARAVSAMSRMSSGISSALASARSSAYTSGLMIGIGLANGMQAMYGRVAAVATQLAAQADRAIAARAKIGSPSKITTAYGAWFGEGWINGMEKMVPASARTAEELVSVPDMRIPTMSSFHGSLGDEYSYDSRPINITVVSELDGKQIARSTVSYMSDEQERYNRRNQRKLGIA